MESLCHTSRSKRQYWPDQCYGWCRKTEPQWEAFSVSIHEEFCSSCVAGVRWFGVSFLKPVQQQNLCLYPAKSGPHCHIGLILNSHLVWFAHGGGSSLGWTLIKLENSIWGKVLPKHTHACTHILCPIRIGTITRHSHLGVNGIAGDRSTAKNVTAVSVSASGTALPSEPAAGFPLASLQEKVAKCCRFFLCFFV